MPKEDSEILINIVTLQEEHSNGVGYREMTRLIRKKFEKTINAKRVKRLMKENNLLSSVRVRKFS